LGPSGCVALYAIGALPHISGGLPSSAGPHVRHLLPLFWRVLLAGGILSLPVCLSGRGFILPPRFCRLGLGRNKVDGLGPAKLLKLSDRGLVGGLVVLLTRGKLGPAKRIQTLRFSLSCELSRLPKMAIFPEHINGGSPQKRNCGINLAQTFGSGKNVKCALVRPRFRDLGIIAPVAMGDVRANVSGSQRLLRVSKCGSYPLLQGAYHDLIRPRWQAFSLARNRNAAYLPSSASLGGHVRQKGESDMKLHELSKTSSGATKHNASGFEPMAAVRHG